MAEVASSSPLGMPFGVQRFFSPRYATLESLRSECLPLQARKEWDEGQMTPSARHMNHRRALLKRRIKDHSNGRLPVEFSADTFSDELTRIGRDVKSASKHRRRAQGKSRARHGADIAMGGAGALVLREAGEYVQSPDEWFKRMARNRVDAERLMKEPAFRREVLARTLVKNRDLVKAMGRHGKALLKLGRRKFGFEEGMV